jgi:hypothetical protein
MKNKTHSTRYKVIRFFLFLLVCMIIGFFAGYGTGALAANDLVFFDASFWNSFLINVFPWLYDVVALILLTVMLSLIIVCKNKLKVLDFEDEEALDAFEKSLDLPYYLCTFGIIFDIFCIGLLIQAEKIAFESDLLFLEKASVAEALALMIALAIASLFATRSIIEMEKKLNPEKEGDLLDPGFTKTWFASFDEGQKHIAYQASYKAMIATNISCLVLALASFFSILLFDSGILPLLFVCILWAINTFTYMFQAAK